MFFGLFYGLSESSLQFSTKLLGIGLIPDFGD